MKVEIGSYIGVAKVFQALADKGRVAVMALLAKGEMNVSAICEKLQSPQGSVSTNLSILYLAGLVKRRRDGKLVYYSHADLRLHRSGRKSKLAADGSNAAKFGPVELILT